MRDELTKIVYNQISFWYDNAETILKYINEHHEATEISDINGIYLMGNGIVVKHYSVEHVDPNECLTYITGNDYAKLWGEVNK